MPKILPRQPLPPRPRRRLLPDQIRILERPDAVPLLLLDPLQHHPPQPVLQSRLCRGAAAAAGGARPPQRHVVVDAGRGVRGGGRPGGDAELVERGLGLAHRARGDGREAAALSAVGGRVGVRAEERGDAAVVGAGVVSGCGAGCWWRIRGERVWVGGRGMIGGRVGGWAGMVSIGDGWLSGRGRPGGDNQGPACHLDGLLYEGAAERMEAVSKSSGAIESIATRA